MSGPERRPIRLLPEGTVRRIAAGEVIVRPAGAVKELIENALDAGATEIRVEVKDGGRVLVRVTDNGCGMGREDARLSVARHATSKLVSVEDLTRIASFGFRGEALASIAAVSRMTIETNTVEGEPGTRLEVEAGDIREIGECARAVGATVTARTLFYNLPVRLAFLKSASYESKLVVETVKTYALAFPRVRFELVADERSVLKLAAADDEKKRMQDLYDRQTTEGLVELRAGNQHLSVHGWLAEPSQARRFYEVQAVFFNGRPVRNRAVVRAVYDAYGPALGDANPSFALFLETDPARLDVNIHPTKQEVRFADERFLFDFVSEAARKALGIRRSELAGVDDFLLQQGFGTGEGGQIVNFWQLHNSYIVAEVISGYVIVDQHAAHERIVYEEVLGRRRSSAPQGLLFPVSVDLSAEQLAAYQAAAGKMAEMGMRSKLFSGRTVVVESVPAGSYMGRQEIEEFFAELGSAAADRAVPESELAKLVACKAAIKAGQRLTQPEMESLCNRLFACAEPHYCPHGRPTIIKFPLEELDRKFGRTG